MIDFIKTKELIIPVELNWVSSVIEKTGEMKHIRTAKYDNLEFIDKKGRVSLKGSLHKYFNKGVHNYNDFTFENLQKVIHELNQHFGLVPGNVQLENIEFGVNIELPYKVDKILNNAILHKNEPFQRFNYGNGIECSHSQYFIKIYDKGLQYNQNRNLLRIEIKVIKMAFLQSHGITINFLSDLLKKDNLQAIGELLAQTIEEILFSDIELMNNDSINEKERLIIAQGSNPNYWKNLIPVNNEPDYKKRRKHFYRQKERFETTVRKYSPNLNSFLKTKIRDKFTDLLKEAENKKRDKFTDLNRPTPETKKGTNLPTLKEGEGTNLPLVYSVRLSHPENMVSIKICPVTNLEIHNQKTDSKFLSIQGIKYYHEYDKTIYGILEKRLSKKWQHEPLSKQINEIAHSIRNEFYNAKHNYKKWNYRRGVATLFDNCILGERLKRVL